MFGQTVTASGDTMSQVRNARFASPKKWVAMDIECEAGCGVLPFQYRDRNLVNALQWCVGLELFLLIEDPWRVFLTTDHPNGAPFTTYPHLIRLLMDRSFRRDMLATIHKGARALSSLDGIDREYSLYEIAIVTRAGPARILGIHDRHGHLGPGALADVTVYDDLPDRERMFAEPAAPPQGRPPGHACRHHPRPRPPRRHPRRPPRLRRRDHGPDRPVLRGLPRHAARELHGGGRGDRGRGQGVRGGA